MKTVCLNCCTVLTDETGRREEALFVSPSAFSKQQKQTSDDGEITWARCLLCADIASQRNDIYDFVLKYNWSSITQEDETSVTVTCHDNKFNHCIKLHMGDAEAKELSSFIRGIMLAKGLISK